MLQGVFDEGEADVFVGVHVQEAGGQEVSVIAEGRGGGVCGEEGEALERIGEGGVVVVVVFWRLGDAA